MSSSNQADTFIGRAKQSVVAVYETLVATIQLSGKKLERWNTGLDLPKMYRSLGKHVFSTGRFRNEFSHAFSALDAHQKELDALEESKPAEPDGADPEAAKQTAASRREAESSIRSISRKMDTEFEKLGQSAWERHGESSGPADLVAPIREAHQRRERLTAEIEVIRASFTGRRLTPKRLVFGAAGCLVIFVLLLPQAIRNARETQRRRDAERLTAAEVDAPQPHMEGAEQYAQSTIRTAETGSVLASVIPTATDDFLERLRQITGGQYIDMRGPFREGNSTEYGVLMGHPPSDPSNAVDSTTIAQQLGEPDLIQQESGSLHRQRWSYRLTDGIVTFRVSNYDVLRDKGLQPDGGILVDGSSIKVIVE